MLAYLLLAIVASAAAETIHYDGFSLTNTLSCHQAAWPPMTEAEIGTKFYMYNPSHRPPNGGVQIKAGETSKMLAYGFNSNKNTHFVIHGYLSNHFHEDFYAIINGFIDKEGANVFAVDWENGAKVGNYNKARQNIRVVGNQAAIFADELGQNINKIHFCGHSLGSHTSGYAGEALKAKGKTLPRITGLDPAGPGFNNENDARCRLDKTDATFVDNIHTDDDMYGTSTEMGHVDFFPNGGANQPGCTVDIASCSHGRVNPLYAETITSSCNFKSYPCSSYPGTCNTNCGLNDKNCNYMGYKASSSKATGRLYLQTNGNSPYCKE
ncbi:Lipase member I [Holothuria leucospilota]|uniref:Lipase member I n=1 Tax=Holothuria leucospilota TaxID=206669 RepID=A0A9Q1HAH5_HOLLE|nr:Lipase member I [Holothuria leucospilota]